VVTLAIAVKVPPNAGDAVEVGFVLVVVSWFNVTVPDVPPPFK
jgi:hypothetical protein